MRALLPHQGSDPDREVDVHDWYARDWLANGGLRVNFISSIDGAVSVAGRSGGLQTPGDNRIFGALRDLADVVVVGAGTARAEGYRPARPDDRRGRRRHADGLSELLPIAVVSRSLRMKPSSALFTDAAARTIVLTSDAADPDLRRALSAVADVVVCGAENVDPAAARSALESRGHRRILCEGGPQLFADFARAGTVDELCLSIPPLLAGPGPGRIVAGTEWDGPHPMRLHGLLEEDGALFCRYRSGEVGAVTG